MGVVHVPGTPSQGGAAPSGTGFVRVVDGAFQVVAALAAADAGADPAGAAATAAAAAAAASLPLHGTADAVSGATFTKSLVVDTGNVTIHGNAAGSALTVGTTASVSGTNTGDQDLSGKADKASITGATKTKITYSVQGIVTAGADATTADIADSADRRYCTDAQKTVIAATSGTNTGDQVIPAGGTPALTLGTANSAGVAATFVRTDATLLAFDATVPVTQAFGDSASAGAATVAARRDHKHAMPSAVAIAGAITSSGAGIGYASGAGGTVTQGTSRATGVTLSKLCGKITMFSAAVAASGTSSFVLTNTFIAATDIVIAVHASSSNGGAWAISVLPASGSATITVRNVSNASITEATPIFFAVLKAVQA